MQCWNCHGEVAEEHTLGGLCFFCAPEDANIRRDREVLDQVEHRSFWNRLRGRQPTAG